MAGTWGRAARAWPWSLCAIAWLVAASAWAGLPETPRLRQLTVADGLPSNTVLGLAEDRQGYLWVATKDGLARYDGLGFRVWRNEQGLRDNQVWAVHVDARDRLWIGTSDAGLAMLEPSRQAFRYYDQANTPALGSNDVWTITSTPDGAIWFGTATAGLYRLDAAGKVTGFQHKEGDPRSLPDNAVTHLKVGADGTLWIATQGGAARWTGRDFERVPGDALNDASVEALATSPEGSVWFGTNKGVSQRTSNGKFLNAPLQAYGSGPVMSVLLADHSGGHWLDIPTGLGRIGDGRIENVPLYSHEARSIVRPNWSMGFEDSHGGVWFASYGNGLWYLPADWQQFSVLSRQEGDETSQGNAYVRAIAPSRDGDMWLVGTGGALDKLDPETGAVARALRSVGDGVPSRMVGEDSTGKVWVGSVISLTRFDPNTNAVKRWAADSGADAPLEKQPLHFVETRAGEIWLGFSSGVQVRDLAGKVLANYPRGGNGIDAEAELDQMGLGPEGAVWLAGSQGLLVWNAGSRRFDPIPGGPGMPAIRVYGFAFDADGDVWLARLGVLERYGWDGAKLKLKDTLGLKEGIPFVASSGLVVDRAGIVWISSVRGLIRVDPAQREVRLYGVQDGLPSQEFTERPVQRTYDGRILLGSPNGLVIFNPAAVRPSRRVPEMRIESISIRRGDHRIELPTGRPFDIRYGDRDLRVAAKLLTFDNAGSNRFRYRLVGYDPAWVEVGASGERDFSQLEPGHYRLEIAGRTADNVWSQVRALEFGVAPPWWQTWWALVVFAVLALLLSLAAAAGYRRRVRRRNAWLLAEHKRKLAEQASLAKTRFLATLGHEVRTPMTGVLGMGELLLGTSLDDRQRGYANAIQNAGKHLLRLVNDALDLARIEAGKLELEEQDFDLRELVAGVTELVAPMARKRGLRFDESIDADAPRALRGDPLRVRQILLNLLNNAVKFTEQGSVGLRVSAGEGGGVRFTISDTGPGLNAEQRERLFQRFEQAEGARTAARYGGSGLGLAICQELAHAMGGRIGVDSAPGQGARFIVELPLSEAVVAPSPMAATSSPAPGSAPRALRVLLVEDDPTVAEVVVGLLQAQGHAVNHAPHGLAALMEVASAEFDIALLDLDLPGLDGLALARQLRAQGFSAPLLAVTARADADAEPAARAAGFDGFLRKPLTGAMLAEAIEALLPARI